MQIFIKTLIGPCFAIPCEATDSILVIKQKMEKNYEEGMPPDQMRLLWGGRQLEDERTLQEYNVIISFKFLKFSLFNNLRKI